MRASTRLLLQQICDVVARAENAGDDELDGE
mgnify:CR=1 FL=1